jgi:hypothetical protein
MSADLRVTRDQIGRALAWLRANKPFFMELGFSEELYEELSAIEGMCLIICGDLRAEIGQWSSFNTEVKHTSIPYSSIQVISRMTRV